MLKFFRPLLACTLVFLVNCIVMVKSIKDPAYTSNPTKIFIHLEGTQGTDKFFNGLGNNLILKFKESNIESQKYVASSLSLDGSKEIKEKIETYNPDLLMTITQTEYQTFNGANSGTKLEVGLFPLGSDKPVWKAEVNSQTSGYGGMGIPSQIAGSIITKMAKDGIIMAKENNQIK